MQDAKTLEQRFDDLYADSMIAHRWFAKRFGESMNGRTFAVKCEMADALEKPQLPNAEEFEPKMQPELESALRSRFADATRNLARLAANPGMGPSVLAFSTGIVVKLAMIMFGDKLALQMFNRLMTAIREGRGICACGKAFRKDGSTVCKECFEEISNEERLLKSIFPDDKP